MAWIKCRSINDKIDNISDEFDKKIAKLANDLENQDNAVQTSTTKVC